jgi:mannose-6-phosphate isomerase-like protein (cupin superfamily)
MEGHIMADAAVSTDTDTEKRRKAREAKAAKARVRPPQAFKYDNPKRDAGKTMVNLGQTDVVRGLVQIVKKGEGDNNLHLHTGMDSLWFVLKGRVKFYGENDEVLGEYGPQEGLIMPRNNVYWFASVGDEDLELLQCVGYDRDVKNERVDMAARKWKVGETEHIDGRVPVND